METLGSINKSEKQFESDIEQALLSDGYRKLNASLYDTEKMLFPDVLVEFIQTTQPRAWLRYEKRYGDAAGEKLARRVNNAIESGDVLTVLKNGITDMGISLKLCSFKPNSSLNPELVADYEKNIVGVTRQFSYSLTNRNTIDMVLSINGIPLIALELKNQFKGQCCDDAVSQWIRDRDPREPIFAFGKRFLCYFAVDLLNVRMTTRLAGNSTVFLPFDQGSNGAGVPGGAGNPGNEDGYATAYLWERVLSRDSLLDLVHRFITITETRKDAWVNGVQKTTVERRIIFPRFHQYDVVHKVIDDIREKGAGVNYLIDHSAGSGKSNSIAWTAYRLASLFDENDHYIFDSIIVVTNRIVLDSQLQDTIKSFEHKPGLVECITQKKGSRGLVEALNDHRKIIICTIQKFLYAYKDFDDMTDRRFAIIIDEAHQGQSGESARTLRSSLIDVDRELKAYAKANDLDPADIDETVELYAILGQGWHANQTFLAFTATPINKTLELFGTPRPGGGRQPFHIYSMRQAIEEGFILDVLQNYVTIREAFEIARKTDENPELIEDRTKRALFRYYHLHEVTITQKVDVIMDSFLHNGRRAINGHGKAMIVTASRKSAVYYHRAVRAYIEAHPAECAGCGVLIAFSGKVIFDDGVECVEAEMNRYADGRRINSDAKLRKALRSDEFNILVVADKYQTGYDEPLLNSMFIDKKLHGVRAVQTLSRLNRTHPGKDMTYVLDFANSRDEIQQAFDPFYAGIQLTGETDFNSVYDLRTQLMTFAVFSTADVECFVKEMKRIAAEKRQSTKAIGRLADIIRPSIRRYNDDLGVEQRHKFRETLLKFTRCYGFVTQLARIDDEELFRDYQFASHLIRFLPKEKIQIFDLTGKIALQYADLKETFRGQIILKGEETSLHPPGQSKPKSWTRKTDTLKRIIDKVNSQYGDNLAEADRETIDKVYKMMMADKVVGSKLARFAVGSNPKMFINSIFPDEFKRILQQCVENNCKSYEKLLGNLKFQEIVMNAMASEFYNFFLEQAKKKDKPSE